MMQMFSTAYWSRALSNPWIAAGLAVDLAPVIAVVILGWRATPLVLLYWLENLIIGAATLVRILTNGFAGGPSKGLYSLFLGGFFTVHYGVFCLVHGAFLAVLASGLVQSAGAPSAYQGDPFEFGSLVGAAMSAAPGMSALLALLIIWQAAIFADDFFVSRRGLDADLQSEMFAPYGRVIVLHVGIFAGFAALAVLGEPMIGVLGLIMLRAAWGVFISSRRWAATDLVGAPST